MHLSGLIVLAIVLAVIGVSSFVLGLILGSDIPKAAAVLLLGAALITQIKPHRPVPVQFAGQALAIPTPTPFPTPLPPPVTRKPAWRWSGCRR